MQDDEAFNQKFFGYGASQTLHINFTEISSNELDLNSNVTRAKKILASCEPAYMDLSYSRGSMIVAVDNQDLITAGVCSLAIVHTAGAVTTDLDCVVPQEKMAIWNGWANLEAPRISEIREHCKEINSFIAEIVLS